MDASFSCRHLLAEAAEPGREALGRRVERRIAACILGEAPSLTPMNIGQRVNGAKHAQAMPAHCPSRNSS